MIDRTARNSVAEATRHYVSGFSTNFEFDGTIFDPESNDLAIEAVRQQLWLVYDDLREHRNREKWRLTSEQRDIVIRIIVFLKSDFEYQWPPVPTWYSIARPLIWVLTFGYLAKRLDQRFGFQDPENVWPFGNREDMELAAQQPRYLAGAT